MIETVKLELLVPSLTFLSSSFMHTRSNDFILHNHKHLQVTTRLIKDAVLSIVVAVTYECPVGAMK